MNLPTEQIDRWGERWLRIFWRKPPVDVAERTRRRVTVHLLPFLFLLYILAYLDRVNVSVAQLGMELSPGEGGVGFSRSVVAFGAGMFFAGYWILEIPSALSVVRGSARWVFVRVLVLWGACATLVAYIGLPFAAAWFSWLPHLPENWLGLSGVAQFVNGLRTDAKYQFYFFRFMLGFFEGGFFPSVIMYLSLWFRTQDRAKAIALFMAAIPLSSAIGSPISSALLGVHWFGLPGWRWIFIVEGLVPVCAAIATMFLLPDRPEKARWLPEVERSWLMGELEAEHRSKQTQGHGAWVHHLGMVFLLTAVYFGLNVMSYGLSTFMPAIIKSQSGVSSQVAGYLATVPFVFAFLAMLLNGWHSDLKRERIWHVCVPLATVSVGMLLAAALDAVPLASVLIIMVVVGSCMYAHLPTFWPIPTMFLGAAAAASAIGFINMFGNLGGFLGPNIVGRSVDEDIRWVDSLLKDAHGEALAGGDLLRLNKLAETMAGSNRLTAEQASRLDQLLNIVRAGQTVDHSQQIELNELLAKGASFAGALQRLAPWPMMSAVIILLVGYFRRRVSAKRLAPAELPGT
ncbi:MAG TPA: MFS transporter [Pirellulales bacterium]|jgi:ACS family tartrate transporter-like MFS transporter|nr:MFS transporter [Pirellulales bacterium]